MPVKAVCVVLLATALGGCGTASATPALPSLSDPSEIVSRSFAQMEAAASVHVDGTLSGSVDPNSLSALLGGPETGLSGRFKLDGASITGDVDMVRKALHLTASFPSLFGSSAELLLVDGYTYTKIKTLLSPADQTYTKLKVPTSLLQPSAGPDSTPDFAEVLKQLKTSLDSAGATAVLVGEEKVVGRDAYHVTESLPADMVTRALEAAGGGAASGVSLDLAPVDYWVYVDSLQPASLQLSFSSPALGTMILALTLTNYDQPVTIQAPPDSQVGGS